MFDVNLEKVLWSITVLFSVIFTIQTVLSFIGIDHFGDLDVDHGHGNSHGGSSFHLFTLQNFVSFWTMFGWSALAMLKSGFPPVISIGVATLSGIVISILIATMFYFAHKMTEDNTFDINDLVGTEGKVYLTIPKSNSGVGKVMIIFGSQKELGAMTEYDEDLLTDSLVRVKSVTDSKILVVEPR